jgi:hypothetical protein
MKYNLAIQARDHLMCSLSETHRGQYRFRRTGSNFLTNMNRTNFLPKRFTCFLLLHQPMTCKTLEQTKHTPARYAPMATTIRRVVTGVEPSCVIECSYRSPRISLLLYILRMPSGADVPGFLFARRRVEKFLCKISLIRRPRHGARAGTLTVPRL